MNSFYLLLHTRILEAKFTWSLRRMFLLLFVLVLVSAAMSTIQVSFRYDNEGAEKWWLYYFYRQLPVWLVWVALAPLLTTTTQWIIARQENMVTAYSGVLAAVVACGVLSAMCEGLTFYISNVADTNWRLPRVLKAFISNKGFFYAFVAALIFLALVLQQFYGLMLQRKEESPVTTPDGNLVVRHKGRTELIPLKEISHLSASGSYVEIYSRGGKSTISGSLKSFERQLPHPAFLRIHRSFIVRSDAVRELIPLTNDDYKVITHGDSELRLSRTYKQSLSFILLANRPAK